jgi:hypothetical protein
MKIRHFAAAFCVLGLVWALTPGGARADEILQGNGVLLIQGGAGCTPAPCTQTIDFTVNILASSNAASFFTPNADFLSSTVTGTGPLGTGGSLAYGQSDEAEPGFSEFEAYLETSSHDEIDLLFSLTQNGADFTLSAPTPYFYSCTSTSCVDAFIPPAYQSLGYCTSAFGCESAQAAPIELVSFSDSATQVPEPSSRAMLWAPMGLLLVMADSRLRRLFRRAGLPTTA